MQKIENILLVMHTYLLLLLSLLIIRTECSFYKKEAIKGSNVAYVRTCEIDKDSTLTLNTNYNKYNRTHYGISVNLTVLEPIDSSYSAKAEVMKWGDGGWKRNYFRFERNDACVSLYFYLGPIWAYLLNTLHAEQGCPLKPGYYHFENRNFQSIPSPFSVEPGRFYFIVQLLKHAKVVFCIESEYESFEMYT